VGREGKTRRLEHMENGADPRAWCDLTSLKYVRAELAKRNPRGYAHAAAKNAWRTEEEKASWDRYEAKIARERKGLGQFKQLCEYVMEQLYPKGNLNHAKSLDQEHDLFDYVEDKANEYLFDYVVDRAEKIRGQGWNREEFERRAPRRAFYGEKAELWKRFQRGFRHTLSEKGNKLFDEERHLKDTRNARQFLSGEVYE